MNHLSLTSTSLNWAHHQQLSNKLIKLCSTSSTWRDPLIKPLALHHDHNLHNSTMEWQERGWEIKEKKVGERCCRAVISSCPAAIFSPELHVHRGLGAPQENWLITAQQGGEMRK